MKPLSTGYLKDRAGAQGKGWEGRNMLSELENKQKTRKPQSKLHELSYTEMAEERSGIH
jgi:hypothetical protein